MNELDRFLELAREAQREFTDDGDDESLRRLLAVVLEVRDAHAMTTFRAQLDHWGT